MTTCNTLDRAYSPEPSTVQLECEQVLPNEKRLAGRGETDSQDFEYFFSMACEDLLNELEAGLSSKLIRFMARRYITDNAVSDHSFALALNRMQDTAKVLEASILTAVDEAISVHEHPGHAASFEV